MTPQILFRVLKLLSAACAGGMYALSFAPYYWWPLSLLSLFILFAVWLKSSRLMAVASGFVFGTAAFGVGVSWMYISLHTYGGMSGMSAGLAIALAIVLLALYPALCGAVQALFRKYPASARLCLVMPASWVLVEWLRSWLFTGFPWLSAGYAYLDTPLSNYVPIGGVYLVGLIALLSAGTLVSLFHRVSPWNGVMALLLCGVWFGGWMLNTTAWTRAHGGPVKVAIVQNNFSLMEKWDADERAGIIGKYLRISQPFTDTDLIVWPEAAVPDYVDNLSERFWRSIDEHPADFIFGALQREVSGDGTRHYNSVIAASDQIMVYRKQHLVPFGEYFPLKWLLGPLFSRLEIPMSDFDAWKSPQVPLIAADIDFAVSICFEDAFPAEIRNQVALAGALVNVSEDIWFGDSFAPHQRLQMARFRARESERPMIRASNNGLSSLIDWRGRIHRYAGQFVSDVVTGEVQPRTGVTPYIAFGDTPVLTLAGVLLALGAIFSGAGHGGRKWGRASAALKTGSG